MTDNILINRFQCGNQSLAYTRYPSPSKDSIRLLSLHGAGPAGRERMDYVCRYLQIMGVESFTFDFSGHGESTGTLAQSSLKLRTEETLCATKAAGWSTVDILVGTSMGAYIALTVLEIVKPTYLVLFCPALYDDTAYDVPFDERFTRILRQEGSFENSKYIETLSSYSGSTILFIGTKDAIIPHRVVEIYEKCRHGRDHQTIWLDNVEHVIHRWATASPANAAFVNERLSSFLKLSPGITRSVP